MTHSIYSCHQLADVDEHSIAQAELEAYLEAQAQAIAPEPDIKFVDINDTYDFKCYVNNEIIAEITFDTSINTQPWSISIAGVKVYRTSIYPEAIEWVKMQYISKVKAIALRTLRAIEIAVVEVHDDEYVVCNQKNGHHYVVRPFHPNPKERCECADCHFRGAKCKHQIAVEQFIRSQTAQSQVLVA